MRGRIIRQLLASVLVNSVYAMKNYPVVLINTVLAPISFLVIVNFVSRGALLSQAIEGAFIMSMFSSGMGLQSDLSHLKNDFKIQDMVVSSPASPAAYVLGMALSEIVYSIPALVTLIVLMAAFVHPGVIEALELMAVMLMMFTTSVTLGFTLSTFTSDIVQSFAFSGLISTLFTTLPPVYYPITYIPLPFRYLAYLSPTTYAAEIAQSTTGLLQVSTISMAFAWVVLAVVTIAFGVIAVTKARWREV
ncbi:MAG TPA: ABC transporter permease [Nitrososphaerales archaeon]|nr:ABC transporter permease [Nitrososphaerales archaeon]